MTIVNPFYGDGPRPSGRGPSFRELVDKKNKRRAALSLADGDWERNAQLLAQAVDGGLGVLLARTQDGGAISVTVYHGQNRYRSYAATEAELNELFEAVGEHTKAQ